MTHSQTNRYSQANRILALAAPLLLMMMSAYSMLLPQAVLAQDPVLVIEGGTLIDGTGREPLKNSAVVIEGSRIKAVGVRGAVSYPALARVVRAEGKTVLPGLIDAHIHFMDFMPHIFLHFGVTTVFDTANPTEWILAQREALKNGKIKGPRMFVTGLVIDGPAPPGAADDAAEMAGYKIRVRTADEARAATRNLIRQGVDAIKVHEQLTPGLLQAVVEEAREAGLEVVGHTSDVRESTRVGMNFVEHSGPVTEATQPAGARSGTVPEADMDLGQFSRLIGLLIENGVYFNPTVTRTSLNLLPKKREWSEEALRYLQRHDWSFIPEARLQFWLRMAKVPDPPVSADLAARRAEGLRRLHEFIKKYAQAGGKLITGPDTGSSSGPTNLPGLSMHVEMEALVDAGVTPMQAIMASTKWPAELMHREKEMGTVEAGKLADVIIVDADPLADIRNTRKISTVILGGKIIDTALDPNFRNPMPRAVALDTVLEYMGPRISDIAPRIASEGQATVRLQVTGEKFKPQAVVRFDTSDLATTFVSDKKLEATIGGALLKNVGTYAVTVVNPGSGGGTSNVRYFVVNYSK